MFAHHYNDEYMHNMRYFLGSRPRGAVQPLERSTPSLGTSYTQILQELQKGI